MNNTLAIIWDIDPEIFSIGSFSIRWYGVLFASGFIIGQQIMINMFKREGKKESDVELLTFYMVISTIIGARLGHCLFYQPDIYLADPIKILKIWEGGLASHGATVGILFALWLYAKKRPDQSYLWILDRIVITIALAGCFIRLGNLMNSEIIGKPSDVPFAFQFVNPALGQLEELDFVEDAHVENTGNDTIVDGITYREVNMTIDFETPQTEEKLAKDIINKGVMPYLSTPRYYSIKEHIKVFNTQPTINLEYKTGQIQSATFAIYTIPRHAAQLYESLSCLVLFIISMIIYNKKGADLPTGQIFSIFLIWIFGLRFIYEFLKENQVAFEDELAFNMGQYLSIPLVIIGIWLLFRSLNKPQKASNESN